MDETGFAIRAGRNKTIIMKNLKHLCYLASMTNCDSITIIKFISGDSQVIPSIVIPTAKVYLKNRHMKTDINSSYFLVISLSE
jgi:ribosomal protein S19